MSIGLVENTEHQLVNDGLRIKKIDLSNNDTYWCRADVLETGESRDYPIQLIVSSKWRLDIFSSSH